MEGEVDGGVSEVVESEGSDGGGGGGDHGDIDGGAEKMGEMKKFGDLGFQLLI